jgi:translation initiation factor IF-2
MENPVGRVTHYYNRIGVAVLETSSELNIGDTILFLGHTTDFVQHVTSMQINHAPVQSVGAGQEVAIKVDEPVRKSDEVYLVADGELERYLGSIP